MDLSKEIEIAIRLARRAGVSILEFYALEIVAEEKFGVDNTSEPVTIADKTASRIIVEGLAEEFPADGILSEEEIDLMEIRASSKRVWMIDPIDGTWGFIKKHGDFGVQIGLVENGEVIVGVVFLPFHNQLFYAAKNTGSFLVENDGAPERLSVSEKTNFNQMSLASSRNHRSPRMYRILEDFNFRMTDLFGAPLKYDLDDVQNHNGICATNGVAHEAALLRLKPLLNEFGRLRVKAGST